MPEQPCLLLAVDGSGENHAGGGHSVGEQTLDEGLELIDGGEANFDEEGLSAGDVMTLLYGVDGGEELEEWAVVDVVAGEPDEGHDGVAEGLFVEQGAVPEDDFGALELVDSLGYGGGGEADLAAKLRVGCSGVFGEHADDVVVDGVQILSHGLLLCFLAIRHQKGQFVRFMSRLYPV